MARPSSGLSVVALVAAAIIAAEAVAYLAFIRAESDSPATWFIALLAAALTLVIYGARPTSYLGPGALGLAGILLVVGGLLGLMTIGLPLLLAGVLVTAEAWRLLPQAT